MIVDCDSCAVRGLACSDCVVSVLLGMPSVRSPGAPAVDRAAAGPGTELDHAELDLAERAALDALAGSGLVPPLRLVPTRSARERPGRRAGDDGRPVAGGPAYDAGRARRDGGTSRAG